MRVSPLPGADVNAPAAWDLQTSARNVVVAVLDSGVDYTHPDLVDVMWTNPGEIPNNGIDDDENGYVDDVYGYDFANNDPDPADDAGHGTHIAGTIAAKGGTDTIGTTGIVWMRCKISTPIPCTRSASTYRKLLQLPLRIRKLPI